MVHMNEEPLSAEVTALMKQKRTSVWKYIVPRSMQDIRHILSIPFIYAMLIPIVLLDVFISVYQATAFPLYRIPKVRRSDYVVMDRRFLPYLNVIQKVNCAYCSYVNGLLAYAVEISARTERYWCPIKSAHTRPHVHSWYKDFAEYGDAEGWAKKNTNPQEIFDSVTSHTP